MMTILLLLAGCSASGWLTSKDFTVRACGFADPERLGNLQLGLSHAGAVMKLDLDGLGLDAKKDVTWTGWAGDLGVRGEVLRLGRGTDARELCTDYDARETVTGEAWALEKGKITLGLDFQQAQGDAPCETLTYAVTAEVRDAVLVRGEERLEVPRLGPATAEVVFAAAAPECGVRVLGGG